MMTRVLLLLALVFAQSCGQTVDVGKAVVKIYSTVADPSYYCPWLTNAPYEVSGSGCIIEDDLILTNAHVVSNVTFLQVRREGDPTRYNARVVAVSHDADLALLTVDKPGFFEGIEPLQFGELPHTRDEVTVYGYPEGGDALSTTQGVISRIESNYYVHSNMQLLAIQIDAAINPGNSGGPAIVDDRIIGVAMQTNPSAENMGYVIPVPVIRHFLDDLEDDSYDGFPWAGFSYQAIANPAITEKYSIGDEQTGVLVTEVAYRSPAEGVLQVGDVILEIDGYAVAGDGTVELQPGVRTALAHLITRRQLGETIELSLIRAGSPVTAEMVLDETFDQISLVPNKIYDRPLEYYIWGGLVFMPLTVNFFETWGSDWYSIAPTYLLDPYMWANSRTEERSEIVVLAYILPDDVNAGYQNMYNVVVTKVNGQPVHDFAQLVEMLDGAEGQYVIIETNPTGLIIMNREDAIAAGAGLMAQYGIPSDRQVEGI